MKLKLKKASKSERLIYIVIFLWIVFGIMSMIYGSNLPQVAGYYASLTLFISTYLWGEHKRTSETTSIFSKGPSSSREIVIYITVLLWTILGLFGIIKSMNINNLTVYFSSLSPFVTSYIIYKTTKGADLPIFNGNAQSMVDKANEGADKTTIVNKPINQQPSIQNNIQNTNLQSVIPQNNTDNKEDQVVTPTSSIEIRDEEV